MPFIVRRKSNVSLGSTVLEFSPEPAHHLQVSGQSHNSYSRLCFYTACMFYNDDTVVVVVVVVVLRRADAEPGGGGGRLTLCYCTHHCQHPPRESIMMISGRSRRGRGWVKGEEGVGGGACADCSAAWHTHVRRSRASAVSCPGDSRGRLSTPPS